MIQRTLTALFSLAVLIFPVSHLYADADSMNSVYSGLECKYLDSYAMEGQMMAGGDVVYHDRLGIGNNAERTRDEPDDPPQDTRQYKMSVACPLPPLEGGTKVAVATIDATVYDSVACQIQSCVAGIKGMDGEGEGAEGECNNSPWSRQTKNEDATDPHPSRLASYITQNVDWITISAMEPPDAESNDDRHEVYVPPLAGEDYGKHWSHLICVLPERDDVSQAPPTEGRSRISSRTT